MRFGAIGFPDLNTHLHCSTRHQGQLDAGCPPPCLLGPGWSTGAHSHPQGGTAWEGCAGEEIMHIPQHQDPLPEVSLFRNFQMPLSCMDSTCYT